MKQSLRGIRPYVVMGAGIVLLCLTAAAILLPDLLGPFLPVFAVLACVLLLVSLLIELNVRRKLREERERIRYHENYTGLGNELMIDRDFKELRNKDGHVLVVIRLNGFYRHYNLFGLKIGDQTIHRLCKPLKSFAEEHHGTVYRLGLDLFGLLVQYREQQQILRDLELLFDELEKVQVVDRHVTYLYHYTFSYGIYFFSGSERKQDDVQQYVYLASSAIDRLGDSRTSGTIFNDENRPDWELRKQLTDDVSKAWERREFVPNYQLIYDLRSKKPIGAELLTRWIHPERGAVLPKDFLPVMESEGLIIDLDLYMLEEACKRIKGWIDEELVTVPLSVNISKLNIHRQDFVERVISVVKAYDIPPILIELEMTESALIHEINDASETLMKQLHDFGFTLSMDNFAENEYNSIKLLRTYPVDVIKISPNFFKNVKESPRERTFITNIIRMAKEMGIKIIVLGVETEEQAVLFRQLGCDYAQGYYFSRPISEELFEKQIF